jgi:hypothetical protein
MAATGIPSRSSLLPLRTLSPGGVAHRPTSLTQSNTAQSQQPTGNTDKGFPKRFSNHWMISRHDFGTGSTHRLAQLFPNNKDSSTRVQHRVPVQEMRSRDFSETDTDSTLTGQGCTRILQDKTQAFFSVSGLHKGLLQTGFPTRLSLRADGSNG